MPIYTIRDKDTLEEEDVFMSYASFTEFLENNPSKERVWNACSGKPMSEDVRHAFEKKGPDKQFNNLLKNISKKNPGSRINTW